LMSSSRIGGINVLRKKDTQGSDSAGQVEAERGLEAAQTDTGVPVPADELEFDDHLPGKTDNAPFRRRDFFDLSPEDVTVHKTSDPVLARRKPVDLKPALGVLCFLLIVGAIIAGIVLIWPSSKARVPNLVGKSLSNAMETARENGFIPTVTGWGYSEKISDGVVISQRPESKKVAKKGSGIALEVSKGPRPETGAAPGVPATIATAPSNQENASVGPLSSKIVTIDPGHQALPASQEWSDPGMSKRIAPDNGGRGVATGNAECLVTLDIALKLKNLLEKDGINVVMTRETSTIDLPEVVRADIANNASSDLYVRIHCGNSEDPSKTGVDTLYPAKNKWTEPFYEKSKEAALFIQEELVNSCGIEDLGAMNGYDMPGLNWSRVPVVEPQAGFLTNTKDDNLLAGDQFRWKVAWGLRNGILKYFNSP
jgi:N-acetylmuramoyl-L-alanine amidase